MVRRRKAVQLAAVLAVMTLMSVSVDISWFFRRGLHPRYAQDTGGFKNEMGNSKHRPWPWTAPATSGMPMPQELTKVRSFHEDLQLLPNPTESFRNKTGTPNCEKWVVMAAVSPDSNTLKQLQALPDWCIVVVGDTNTPKDFNIDGPRSVHLDRKAQEQLGYEILHHPSSSAFSYKNIGYLFAMHHGAQVIYDTDSDNELLQSALNISFIKDVSPLQVRVRGLVWNPYPFFGFEGGWPRGLPLDQVTRRPASVSPANNRQWFKNGGWTCSNGSPPRNSIMHLEGEVGGVWQFLVRGDTDVDAIYRLSNEEVFANFTTSGDVVSLSPGVMAPYNAEATLHHYDAFWGLFLPLSVHSHIADIWRAYVTQRMMWDVGGRLHFVPSQMIAKPRNKHSDLSDFVSGSPCSISLVNL